MATSDADARREAQAALGRECAALSTILAANRRPSVYRHHRFFRRSRHVLLLAKKATTTAAARARGAESEKRVMALLTLQRYVLRATEDCTAELAANRIDTAALSLACVSVLSRLGCCVARAVAAIAGPAFALRIWPASFVNYVTSTPRVETEPRAQKDRAPRESYGGALNAVLRKAAGRSAEGSTN